MIKFAIALILLLPFLSCSSKSESRTVHAQLPAAYDSLPDPELTPGDTLNVPDSVLCTKGYSTTVRHVSGKIKHRVYEEYGITSHEPGEYEIDHLISLELGGSNDIKNLWPQSYNTQPWNAHNKDVLENKLRAMICEGKITRRQAQYEIAHNWINAYKKYVENAAVKSRKR